MDAETPPCRQQTEAELAQTPGMAQLYFSAHQAVDAKPLADHAPPESSPASRYSAAIASAK